LFNIFKAEDLKQAIEEMYRVLKPHGKLVMSDPTCEQPMNDTLRNDERLRALCLSGSLPINEYVKALTDAGFGPCIFTGKAAIYYGSEDYFDDKKGHVLVKNQPLAICDKTAGAIAALGRDDIYISESTYHYDGGGCC